METKKNSYYCYDPFPWRAFLLCLLGAVLLGLIANWGTNNPDLHQPPGKPGKSVLPYEAKY